MILTISLVEIKGKMAKLSINIYIYFLAFVKLKDYMFLGSCTYRYTPCSKMTSVFTGETENFKNPFEGSDYSAGAIAISFTLDFGLTVDGKKTRIIPIFRMKAMKQQQLFQSSH